MTVSLTQGAPDWTITVTDTTNGQTFSTTEKYSGPMTSAEWIQEAPTVNGRIATLADDGTVEFDNATANGVSPGFTSSDSGVMVKRRGRPRDLDTVCAQSGRERICRGVGSVPRYRLTARLGIQTPAVVRLPYGVAVVEVG